MISVHEMLENEPLARLLVRRDETRLLARWCFWVRARTEGAGEQGEDKEGAIFLHHRKEQMTEVLEKKISRGESPLYLLLLVAVLVNSKQVGTGGYQGVRLRETFKSFARIKNGRAC